MEAATAVTVTVLYEALAQYFETFPSRKKYVKTAVLRFLLPYSGFQMNCPVEANVKLTQEETKRRLELTRNISIHVFHNWHQVMSWQEQVFVDLQTSANVRSVYKCHLNHFLSYCMECGWLTPPQPKAWAIPLNRPTSNSGKSDKAKPISNKPITRRHNLIRYRLKREELNEEVQKELSVCRAFWTDPYYGARPNTDIIEEAVFDLYQSYILQLLGWLVIDKLDYHQQMFEREQQRKQTAPDYQSDWLQVSPTPPIWLEDLQKKYPPRKPCDLTLEDLMPVVELRPNILADECETRLMPETIDIQSIQERLQQELANQNASLSLDLSLQLGQLLQSNDFLVQQIQRLNEANELNLKKERAQSDAVSAGNYVKNLFYDFFRWASYQHNPLSRKDGYHLSKFYRNHICNTLMNLAKFRYRNITNHLMVTDYKDIPVVMMLRAVRKESDALVIPQNYVSPDKQIPSWTALGELLPELLEDCAPRYNLKGEKTRKNLGRIRKQTAVASSFQKYLIMLFFRLVSPDRQYVIRHLKIGETLKLCHINLDLGLMEEAIWNREKQQYEAYYNDHTKLYYLASEDGYSETGYSQNPAGKAYEWVVCLDPTDTKIDKENAYRVPKIYNPELQAWLYGKKDFSGIWHNWPAHIGSHYTSQYREQQFHWCGYVDVGSNKCLGFRHAFQPQHEFVFTQPNGKPFNCRTLGKMYDILISHHLGIRSTPHDVRRSATTHYKKKGMTAAQSESLAHIKGHSQYTQDSSAYNKTTSLEKTQLASEMIINEFLSERGLDPNEYGLT